MAFQKSCEWCGTRFFFSAQCLLGRKKFCSQECHLNALHRSNIKKRMTLFCRSCGKRFSVEPHLKKQRRYCGKRCANVHLGKIGARCGSNNGHWKGGLSKTSLGYLLVTHGKNANKYHHRVVMENHLDRRLGSHEIVHHINGNKQDNRVSNLCLMTRAEHARHHASD